mmetsp:Transcript_172892/g.554361  ORF Transcript_172892/g.554361 Transcript_172892/m.554361 type:complete len:308 (-) Transcript_172892:65-988(-)|eukprot:CAMPEP_0204095738 /NCGR_PEP_ID=MMETSP0360-20130528/191588_1 /ASSEMBLY_ACC=CAM_ASM_000342 /TAXON_ID=268821 /ORGANISM="Scrippsiella Hangoei, Strain SHTV-5" /LENGTH=307 /DNA_ID=CAMNT_0051045069 /DNA_START=75 /DNA_END=998 /DNA_ORIENTATION=+
MWHVPFALNPIAGGIVAGVLHTVLSPDHLCTIVTLSACQGAKAFWFGFRWAGGHLAGMCSLGLVCLILKSSFGVSLWESYEYYMEYAIGTMLLACGLYFALNSEKYFDQEWSPKQATCACHAHCLPQDGSSSSHHHKHDGAEGDDEERVRDRLLPLVKVHEKSAASHWELRTTGSVLTGFVQGVACPAGLVGMSFLKGYSMPNMFIFVMVFVIITTLSMGGIAMAYGVLTQRCVSSAALARSIYFASCGLSICIGLAWISLNATGVLHDVLGHDHDHGHDHGVDGHHHHHENEGLHSSAAFYLLALR